MMDLYVKFIDGDSLVITNVTSHFIIDEGFWKIVDNDGRVMFLNKDKIKYIGDRRAAFY